jgi:hypothetical protein
MNLLLLLKSMPVRVAQAVDVAERCMTTRRDQLTGFWADILLSH